MNLTNLLDYANSVYDFNEKINSIERKNKDCKTKPATVIKMFTAGNLTNYGSINSIINAVHKSGSNRLKKIFQKGEFIPKNHGVRDCFNDMDCEDFKKMHDEMIDQVSRNKFFENHEYRGMRVALVDGVESFETSKDIDGLHRRKHKNGDVGYYYKSLGIMYLTDTADLMLNLVPFNKKEVAEDKEHNNKVKSEGEITVFKRIIPDLVKYKIEVAVLDNMFLNAPCLNKAKKNGIDVIAKLNDERRSLYKNAKESFDTKEPVKTYEIVKVSERKIVKYSKKSKKKNIDKTEEHTFTREVTDATLNEKVVTKDKTTDHPNKQVREIKSETVIKRVEVWEGNFSMEKYKYGKVKVIKVRETTSKKKSDVTNEMYIVTTMVDDKDSEFIVDLMHRRWDIELNGFRTLKSRHHMDHLFVGTDNATRIIHYLLMIIYNLMALYFNIHTKKYKNINYINLMEEYKIEIATNENIYKYFLKT